MVNSIGNIDQQQALAAQKWQASPFRSAEFPALLVSLRLAWS
jgi:hypothetical protein